MISDKEFERRIEADKIDFCSLISQGERIGNTLIIPIQSD
jgi:hypothetical protein